MNREGEILTEWRLVTGQAVKSVDELLRSIRAEERAERDLAKVRAKLDDVTNRLSDSQRRTTSVLGGLASSMTASITKGTLLAQGLGLIKNAVRDTLKDLDAYSAAWKQYRGDLDGAREATQGLLGDLELMQARNRMATLGVKMSDAEYNKFAESVTKLSEAQGKDLAEALNKATEAVGRGNTRMAQYLGVVVKATDAEDKRRAILERLHEAAGELAEDTDTLTDEIDRYWVSVKNAVLWSGHWLNINVSLKGAFEGLVGAVGRSHIEKNIENTSRWREEDKRLNDELERTSELLSTMQGVAAPRTATGGAGGMPTDVEGGILGMPFAYGDKPGVGGKKPKASGGKRARASNAFSRPDTDAMRALEAKGAELELLEREKKIRPALLELMGEQNDLERERARRLAASLEAIEAQHAAEQKSIDQHRQSIEFTVQRNAALRDLAWGGLAEFTAGLWAAADAAVLGEESFGMAVAKMLKQTLFAIAQEATVKAIFYTAEGLATAATMNWASAGKFFAAAGLMGAVAVTAGAAGLGVSAGIKNAGGHGGGGQEQRERQREREQTRPSFGTREDKKQPDIYVQVYLDSNNPASALIAKEKIRAVVARAA